MIVVGLVKLAILTVTVIVRNRYSKSLGRFFFPFPLNSPLEILVHNSSRILFGFYVIGHITPSHRSGDELEITGEKFSSGLQEKGFASRGHVAVTTQSGIKPEGFRRLE